MSTAVERVAAQAKSMAEANTILRKIACHVPGKVWIEAREKAGFGVEVHTTRLDIPDVDEAWLQFVESGPGQRDELYSALKQLLTDVQAFDKSGTFGKLRSVQRAAEIVRTQERPTP